mgnify:CR=1 FL=1
MYPTLYGFMLIHQYTVQKYSLAMKDDGVTSFKVGSLFMHPFPSRYLKCKRLVLESVFLIQRWKWVVNYYFIGRILWKEMKKQQHTISLGFKM